MSNPTLLQRADMVQAGGSIGEVLLDVWNAVPPQAFPTSAAGTRGPKEADVLPERNGRQWRRIKP